MNPWKIVDWVIYGNFWIALAALCCGWMVQWMGVPEPSGALLALLFFATLLRYDLIGFTVSATAQSPKFQFAYQYRKWLQGFAMLSAVVCCVCLYWLHWQQWLVLAHLGILSFLYIFPIPGLVKPLRRLPYVKIFLIAYVWACSSWWLPAIQGASLEYLNAHWAMVFVERFLFYFAITIPFDIRDLKTDRETSVKTIPLKIGVRRSKWLGSAALLICAILTGATQSLPVFLGLFLGYVLALLLLWGATDQRGDRYSLGAVDGSMVFQALAVAICQLLFN